MLLDVVAWISGIGACLLILDCFLLTANGKDKVLLGFTHLWSWFDEAKNWSVMRWYYRYRWFVSIATGVVILICAALIAYHMTEKYLAVTAIVALAEVPIVLMGVEFLSKQLEPDREFGDYQYLWSLVAGAFFLAGFYRLASWTGYETLLAAARFNLLLLIFFTLCCLPLLFVQLAKLLLHIAEFLLRRTIEHGRGPVLGVSAVLGAIAAILKAL